MLIAGLTTSLPCRPSAQDTGLDRDRASVEAVGNLEAYTAYKMAQYDRARELWLALAEAGNTTAMVSLANLYAQGQGVPRDPEAAFDWTRQAAERGDVRARLELDYGLRERDRCRARQPSGGTLVPRGGRAGRRRRCLNLGVMLTPPT